jgi:serine/threonine-protein kinase RsbW
MNKSEVVRIDIPATLKHLNIVGASVAALLERVEGLTNIDDHIYNTQLAVQEACVNIVNHAYEGCTEDGRIQMSLIIDDEPLMLTIILEDNGRSFKPQTVPFPDLENGQVHGYGLYLMRELMDKVTYKSELDCNQWTLIKYL